MVAAVIVVAVYFGIKSTTDTYQEAWHTFRDQEGRYMEERVNKTKDTTEVDVPNSVQIIYDYTNGISVERYTDVSTKVRGPCYVRYISSSKDQNPVNDAQTTNDVANKGEMEQTQHWKFTDRKVPSHLTSSPRVQEMCKDTDIFWMEEVSESSIQKRAIYPCYLYRITPTTYLGKSCWYYYYLCYDHNGKYIFTYWELRCKK